MSDPIQSISPPPIYDKLLKDGEDMDQDYKIYDKLLEDDGKLTQAWQDWLSQLQLILNQVIDKINTL